MFIFLIVRSYFFRHGFLDADCNFSQHVRLLVFRYPVQPEGNFYCLEINAPVHVFACKLPRDQPRLELHKHLPGGCIFGDQRNGLAFVAVLAVLYAVSKGTVAFFARVSAKFEILPCEAFEFFISVSVFSSRKVWISVIVSIRKLSKP